MSHAHAHSRIKLKISCINLPHSSSNQVIMHVKDSRTQQWVSTFRKTEVINSSNPEFTISIIVDYYFERLQQLRFICMSKHEKIGHYDCSLGSFFSSTNNRKIKEKLYLDSNDNDNDALIIISAEEVKDSQIVALEFQAHNIAKVGFLNLIPQAFLILSRSNEDGTYSPVHKTKSISSTHPSWPGIETTIDHRELKIQVKNERGDVSLGECTVTPNELLEGNSPKLFPLKLPRGTNPKDSRLVINASLEKKEKRATFLDYIAGGTLINLVIAIDFTESNGDPEDPDSLHYIRDENNENDYQQAIRSVGTILEQYSSIKKIPVFGFGGKFYGKMSHAYPLNNNFEDAEVDGIDGVMKEYKETMNGVELHYPTYFSPIINRTVKIIKSEIEINKDVYYILLIITDGVITDMDTTVRSIVRANELPLSIIIVGVGDDDFTNMKTLNADDKPLTIELNNPLPGMIKGKDIVQFVAMREFKSGASSAELLAKKSYGKDT